MGKTSPRTRGRPPPVHVGDRHPYTWEIATCTRGGQPPAVKSHFKAFATGFPLLYTNYADQELKVLKVYNALS
ncbi:MAG: hypothetical protein N4A74_26805 [Carboxylicivirga sp.]|nr:hypothetical protein [Carboxylicivirga sp.]